MEKNATTKNWSEIEYIWHFSGFQLLLITLSILLFVLTFGDWLHIFPSENTLIELIPIDLNRYYSGKDILGLSSFYCLLITVFATTKTLNNFLLPLLIAGIYLFYYAVTEFIIQLKSPLGHDIIKKWFDYKLLIPLYLFVIIYFVLIILAALILFNKKHKNVRS